VKDATAHPSRLFARALHSLKALLVLLIVAGAGLLAGCAGEGKEKASARQARMEGDFGGGKDKDGGPAMTPPAAAETAPGNFQGGGGFPRPAAPAPLAKSADGRPQADVDAIRDPYSRQPFGPTVERPGGGTAKGKEDPKPPAPPPVKEKPKSPVVWHRDASRPTFARVYVGDGNALELVSLHVSVTIDGPRARTVVDHVFRNPHARALEGTFEYPLPAGASPCYFAMFLGASRDAPPIARFRAPVTQPGKKPIPPESLPPALLARQIDTADWGKLQEARVVAPQRAAEAYEEVVRGRVDPALLEYASGNTFRGRVFPIQAKGYNRVLLAYEETLPVSAGRLLYRFGLPGCKLHEMRLSLQADPKQCLDATFQPNDARKDAADDRLGFERTWSDATPAGDVLFSARPADAAVQACSGRQDRGGPLYLCARLRPKLPEADRARPFARQAVFLLDTSLSEQPDRFAVSMKLLKSILEADSDLERFNVLAFNAGACWAEPKGWLPNTKEGREKALSRLDGVLLEGATDLSAALEKVVEPGWDMGKDAVACFLLSDGHLTWGETEAAPLVARFRQRCARPVRFFCYRTGLGEESAELFEALTRDGGAVFQCFGEADVAAAARAHRRACLQVERVRLAGIDASEVLLAGRRSAVYPDGELLVAAQLKAPGKAAVVVEGTFQGEKFSQSFPVEAREEGELAARGWGELAVASLLALGDPWTDDLVTAYCQQFNVGCRCASFLVLESEADYKRFDLDKEKQKTLKGELSAYLDNAWSLLAREGSARQAFGRLLFQIDGRTKVLSSPGGAEVKKLLALLGEEDCRLPHGAVAGALLREKEANAEYLQARGKDRRSVHPYLQECQRRYNDGDTDGAVRVLSSVIEEHAGRGDALRLAGYRLLDMRRPDLAAALFGRVLRQRPFEPHSFRDLARSLEDARRYPLAALLYEAVLAGTWHNRFGAALQAVTREEYARMLRLALREGQMGKGQRDFLASRLAAVGGAEQAAGLRVSITWNTDNTDIDLWVVEPDGTRVFYSQPRSPAGGVLSPDQTQGYGPERYHIPTARPGTYKVLVHYYRANANLLGGETHVSVVITRHAGTDHEKVERRTVILRREGEQVKVAEIRF
jgi:hypothetical protein